MSFYVIQLHVIPSKRIRVTFNRFNIQLYFFDNVLIVGAKNRN
jgi:hypothetical protein